MCQDNIYTHCLPKGSVVAGSCKQGHRVYLKYVCVVMPLYPDNTDTKEMCSGDTMCMCFG